MKTLYVAGGLFFILWLASSGKKPYVSKTRGKVLDIRDFDPRRTAA